MTNKPLNFEELNAVTQEAIEEIIRVRQRAFLEKLMVGSPNKVRDEKTENAITHGLLT